ncbi:hypothetical protein F9394_03575 [Escherichia coli]|nr:hypothetical protein [Escherichia coli]
MDRSTLSIKQGATTTLIATVEPSNATNKTVIWTSSDESIATVDASGKVSGVAEGNATITGTTADGAKTATCDVTVTAAN